MGLMDGMRDDESAMGDPMGDDLGGALSDANDNPTEVAPEDGIDGLRDNADNAFGESDERLTDVGDALGDRARDAADGGNALDTAFDNPREAGDERFE